MLSDVAEFVVQGITLEGEIFTPEDWAEGLRDSLSSMGQAKNLNFSSYVRPVLSERIKCLVVRVSLETANIQAFQLIKQYIADHHLRVRAGRGSRDSEGAAHALPAGRERRDQRRNKW